MSDQPVKRYYVDIVFDGPPGHIPARFVEVENQDGAGINFGEWVHREDGYWVLRFVSRNLSINEFMGVNDRDTKALEQRNTELEAENKRLREWADRVTDALCGYAPLKHEDRLRLLVEWEAIDE